jgi:hypothetical protein
MPKAQYQDFHGWTVVHDEEKHEFLLSKPHAGLPPAKHGAPRTHLTVSTSYGTGDPAIAFLEATVAAYEEDALFSNPDDAAIHEERRAAAHKERAKLKVIQAVRDQGAGLDYALPRLTRAGWTEDEALSIVRAARKG